MLKTLGYTLIGKASGDYEELRTHGIPISEQWHQKVNGWLQLHNQSKYDLSVVLYPNQQNHHFWAYTLDEPGQDRAGRQLTIAFLVETEGELNLKTHLPMMTKMPLNRDSTLPDKLVPSKRDLTDSILDEHLPTEWIAKLIFGENFSIGFTEAKQLWNHVPFLFQWVGYFPKVPQKFFESRRGIIICDDDLIDSPESKIFVKKFCQKFPSSNPRIDFLNDLTTDFEQLQRLVFCYCNDELDLLQTEDWVILPWLKAISTSNWRKILRKVPIDVFHEGMKNKVLELKDYLAFSQLEAFLFTGASLETQQDSSQDMMQKRVFPFVASIPEKRIKDLLPKLTLSKESLLFWKELMRKKYGSASQEASFFSLSFLDHEISELPSWFPEYYKRLKQVEPEVFEESMFFKKLAFYKKCFGTKSEVFLDLCSLGLGIEQKSEKFNELVQLFQETALPSQPPPQNYKKLIQYQLLTEEELLEKCATYPIQIPLSTHNPYFKEYAQDLPTLQAIHQLESWQGHKPSLPVPPLIEVSELLQQRIFNSLNQKLDFFCLQIVQHHEFHQKWEKWIDLHPISDAEDILNFFHFLKNPATSPNSSNRMFEVKLTLCQFFSEKHWLRLLVEIQQKMKPLQRIKASQEVLKQIPSDLQRQYLTELIMGYIPTKEDVGWKMEEWSILLPLLDPFEHVVCVLMKRPFHSTEVSQAGRELLESVIQHLAQQFPQSPPTSRIPHPKLLAQHAHWAKELAKLAGWQRWSPDQEEIKKLKLHFEQQWLNFNKEE